MTRRRACSTRPSRSGRKALGPDHPQLASTLTIQANLFVARRQYAEALDVAGQALQILEPQLPADHWLIAMAKNVQGAAFTGLGQYAEAEKLLLASLPALGGSPIAGPARRAGARGSRSSTSPGASRKKRKSTLARPPRFT